MIPKKSPSFQNFYFKLSSQAETCSKEFREIDF